MSENVISRRRQTIVVSTLVLFLAVVSFLLFYYGRQHKVVIDNRSVETADGRNYRSLAGALVAVNHQTLSRDEVSETSAPAAERAWLSFKFWPTPDYSIAKAVEMMPRERILVKILGPGFNLKTEAFDKMGESLGTQDLTVHLGTRRNAMVRLVKLYNDMPDYLEEFPDDSMGSRPAPEEAAPPQTEGDAPPAPIFGD